MRSAALNDIPHSICICFSCEDIGDETSCLLVFSTAKEDAELAEKMPTKTSSSQACEVNLGPIHQNISQCHIISYNGILLLLPQLSILLVHIVPMIGNYVYY